MTTVSKPKPMDHYIKKMEKRALRKFPHLTFRAVQESEDLAYLYYSPYDEDEFYGIIKATSGIATDALVDAGYRIWVMPA